MILWVFIVMSSSWVSIWLQDRWWLWCGYWFDPTPFDCCIWDDAMSPCAMCCVTMDFNFFVFGEALLWLFLVPWINVPLALVVVLKCPFVRKYVARGIFLMLVPWNCCHRLYLSWFSLASQYLRKNKQELTTLFVWQHITSIFKTTTKLPKLWFLTLERGNCQQKVGIMCCQWAWCFWSVDSSLQPNEWCEDKADAPFGWCHGICSSWASTLLLMLTRMRTKIWAAIPLLSWHLRPSRWG